MGLSAPFCGLEHELGHAEQGMYGLPAGILNYSINELLE
jgi:hypothetical protein